MLKSVTEVEITLENTSDLQWPSSSKVPSHKPNFRPINNFVQSGCLFEANRAIHISRFGIHIQIPCLIGVCDSLYWTRSSEKILLTIKSKLHISKYFIILPGSMYIVH